MLSFTNIDFHLYNFKWVCSLLYIGYKLINKKVTWGERIFISINIGNSLEKAMATHCSTLVWKIPWVEEPDGLQSMGSLRVWHDWETSLSIFTFMHWRRKWQPTPVFLPGESQGLGSLVDCRLWGRTSRTRLKQLSSRSSSKFLSITNEWI